jgi:hypothetical protein
MELIAAIAFEESASLKEIVFPPDSGLVSIHGLKKCSSLARIVIPSSVKHIAYRAFNYCGLLTEVVFSPTSRLKRISGFAHCHSLRRIDIPRSVKRIGPNAFQKCKLLEEVTFAMKSRLRIIDAFRQCRSLRSIEIPASVEVLSGFTSCSLLEEITFARESRLQELTYNMGHAMLRGVPPFIKIFLSQRRIFIIYSHSNLQANETRRQLTLRLSCARIRTRHGWGIYPFRVGHRRLW